MGNQEQPLHLAVSACLLGQKVRYDGAHKSAALLRHWPVEWHPICPEVGIGLGVPRPPIEQRYINNQLGIVEVGNWQRCHHDALAGYANQMVGYIKEQRISGYVLMQKSPSCALQSSTLHSGAEVLRTNAEGYFVATLRQRLTHLPMIEEAALHNAKARHGFLHQARRYAAQTYSLAASV